MSQSTGQTRRRFFQTMGAAALGGLALQTFNPRPARAHLPDDVDRTITVIMGDTSPDKPTFFFQIGDQINENIQLSIKAGETVRFVFDNQGKVLHDAHFGRDADLDGRRYKQNMAAPFEMLELESGQVGEVTFAFTEEHVGEWEVGCFQPAHYEQGMKFRFVIE